MKKVIYFLNATFLATLLFMNVTAMGQNPFYIDVLQPDNANIEWVIGETYTISWTDNLSQPVVVRLWNPVAGGGAAYEELAASVTGTSWVWEMANTYTEGDGYHIQVGSIHGSTYDNEGDDFELIYAPANSIRVIQPSVMNISWARGTSKLISWTDNINEPVAVQVSDENGANFTTITGASSLTGTSFVWNIPSGQAVGTAYKIKVVSTDFSTVYDESDNPFTITKTSGAFTEIFQPVDATSWAKSTTHIISWDDNLSEPVDLYYEKLTLGGEEEIATGVIGSTYAWTIPLLITGSDYTVIIKSSLDPSIEITSEEFDLTQVPGGITTIYQPTTTTSWTVGTTHLISWLDNLVEPVDVYYIQGVDTMEIELGVVGTTCYWAIPETGMTTGTNVCRIIVKSSIDPDNVNMTSEYFDLTASSGTDIDVIQPSVSGIAWARNTSHYISWVDDFPEDVDIELVRYDDATTLSNQTTYPPIPIASDVEGSTYVWYINSTLYPDWGFYKVRITSVLDPNLTDMSDNTLALTLSAGTEIDVIQPNGGEVWMAGTSHLISWLDDCTENVYLELYKGGVLVSTTTGLTASTVPGSTYTWEIYESLAAGTDYKIKIKSSLDPTGVYDFSDANFEIVPFGKSANSNFDGEIASAISIYPNPTNGHFTVSSPLSINKVEVRNLLGKLIYSNIPESAQTKIDMSSNEAGIYIVNIIIENEVVAKKLFVK